MVGNFNRKRAKRFQVFVWKIKMCKETNNKIEKCDHNKHGAYWYNKGWCCLNCGEIYECRVKYTTEDIKPKRFEDGTWGQPNPCCPLYPHKERT